MPCYPFSTHSFLQHACSLAFPAMEAEAPSLPRLLPALPLCHFQSIYYPVVSLLADHRVNVSWAHELVPLRSYSPPYILSLAALCASQNRPLLRCFCYLILKACLSESAAICVRSHIPQRWDLELKFESNFSEISESQSSYATAGHFFISYRSPAPNLEGVLSFSYTVSTLHRTDCRAFYFELVVIVSVLSTLQSMFARKAQPSGVSPRRDSTARRCL